MGVTAHRTVREVKMNDQSIRIADITVSDKIVTHQDLMGQRVKERAGQGMLGRMRRGEIEKDQSPGVYSLERRLRWRNQLHSIIFKWNYCRAKTRGRGLHTIAALGSLPINPGMAGRFCKARLPQVLGWMNARHFQRYCPADAFKVQPLQTYPP